MKPLGPSFGDAVIAAGLGGLPFSWGDDGEIFGLINLSVQQRATLDAVIEAYDPETPRTPEEISDRQFFQQLAVDGLITQAEALDAVGPGIIPASMAALIARLPAAQQFPAQMLVRGATIFRRDHPVTALIGQLYGLSSAQIDTLWANASNL